MRYRATLEVFAISEADTVGGGSAQNPSVER